jgi:hypothetical protein
MKAKRIDGNQHEIVQALRKMGVSVAITSMVGHGFPDLCVGFRGHNLLLEIKDGTKCKSQQALTEKEKEFHLTWRGHYAVITSVEEAIDAISKI